MTYLFHCKKIKCMQKIILIVDDSLSIRESISFFLTEEGFSVIKAEDGIDALDKLNNCNPELIITDLHMPNMNGIKFISEVRKIKKYKHLPIILLTTETLKEKKLEAKHAGATGWLNKPFSKEKLIKVINKVIR